MLRANVKPATCAMRKHKAGLIELGYTCIEKLDFVVERKVQESMNQPRPGNRGFVEEDNAPGSVELLKLVNRERHD